MAFGDTDRSLDPNLRAKRSMAITIAWFTREQRVGMKPFSNAMLPASQLDLG
jgi:hypothetical protein